jgi:hypothetical protein
MNENGPTSVDLVAEFMSGNVAIIGALMVVVAGAAVVLLVLMLGLRMAWGVMRSKGDSLGYASLSAKERNDAMTEDVATWDDSRRRW